MEQFLILIFVLLKFSEVSAPPPLSKSSVRYYTDRYLNFRSDHPLQHKRAVFDTLMHRAVTLPSHKLEKRKEIRYIKTALKKNSHPSRILCSRKKTKAKITDSPRSNKGYVTILLFPGLSEKIDEV